jgi:hypothetical protein
VNRLKRDFGITWLKQTKVFPRQSFQHLTNISHVTLIEDNKPQKVLGKVHPVLSLSKQSVCGGKPSSHIQPKGGKTSCLNC